MHQPTGDNYALDADGNRVFTEGPPPTTVDAGIMNSTVYEIINAIIASGQTLAEGPGTDLKNQLATAIQRAAAYDAIVYSQETFNAIWERVAANEYKIKDDIGAVYFKAYSGGYNMSGPSSPLSDGDTWGKFETNACTFIMCDGGNFFQMGDTPSYWEISTSNTVVYNMDVRGVGAVAAAIEKSIFINATANDCKLLFCTVSERISNTSFNILYDANQTCFLLSGAVHDCSGNQTIGIRGFNTVVNTKTKNIQGTGVTYGFYLCENISASLADTIESDSVAAGFLQSTSITGCTAVDITGQHNAHGYYQADAISGCVAQNVAAVTGLANGFYLCNQTSACKADTITSTGTTANGFLDCNRISGCYAAAILSTKQSAYGFYNCDNVSGSQAYDIETSINNASYKAVGFQDCDQLSACQADTIAASAANAYAYGFNNCDRVSACHATTVTAVTASRAYGFNDCDWMDGSNEATAIDDFEFYDCSQEPFRGNAAAATPYGYTEVWTSMVLSGGVTSSYTPTKDGILFGFVEDNGASIIWSFRNGSAGKTVDQKIFVEPGNAENGCFSMPIKGGVTLYVTLDASTGFITLRHMPFGTTT